MDELIIDIQIYKEDHPGVIITRDLIKLLIMENIEKLINEIEERIYNE